MSSLPTTLARLPSVRQAARRCKSLVQLANDARASTFGQASCKEVSWFASRLFAHFSDEGRSFVEFVALVALVSFVSPFITMLLSVIEG